MNKLASMTYNNRSLLNFVRKLIHRLKDTDQMVQLIINKQNDYTAVRHSKVVSEDEENCTTGFVLDRSFVCSRSISGNDVTER